MNIPEILPSIPEPLTKVIEDAILNAMAWTDGNTIMAAELLGIQRQTIHRHLKRMGFVNKWEKV